MSSQTSTSARTPAGDYWLIGSFFAASILCCGVASGPILIYIGVTYRRTVWIVTGSIYSVAYLLVFALMGISEETAPPRPESQAFIEFSDVPQTTLQIITTFLFFGVIFVGVVQLAFASPKVLRYRAERRAAASHVDQWLTSNPFEGSQSTVGLNDLSPATPVRPTPADVGPWETTTQTNGARLNLNEVTADKLAASGVLDLAAATKIIDERDSGGAFISKSDFLARVHLPPHLLAGVLAIALVSPKDPPPSAPHRIVDI